MLLKNYIKTLKQQVNKNRMTKINIHLPVFGKIKEHCIYLNKEVSRVTTNKIDLSNNSFMIPHITLYMGYISSTNFDAICNILDNFVKTLEPLTLSFSSPYIKNNKNYIFINVVEQEKLFNLKKELYTQIKPFVKDLSWDVVKEPAHITIAYIQKENSKVSKLIENYKIIEKLNTPKINISITGKKGTCLGILKEFIKN